MFWLSEKQWEIIEPLLLKDQTYPARTDDRLSPTGLIESGP